MSFFRRWLPLLIITPAMLALDQISKAFVVENMELHTSVPVVPPFLYVTRSFNTGIAFGMGSGSGEFFLLLSMAVTLVVLFFYIRSAPEAIWQRVGLSLTIGGAFGNIIDRLQHGLVVDFFHIIVPGLISNVSNFADHAVVIGVLIIIADDIWRARKQTIAEKTITEPELSEAQPPM